MKRFFIALSLCFVAGVAIAQESEESKKKNYLPQAGDYALGVDAAPFLTYLGNFFNQAGNNVAPFFNGVDNTIYGKYFLSDDRAIRAKLRVNIFNETNKQTVIDDAESQRNPLATTIDRRKNGVTDIELIGGYEFRRGRGRVQGFWGGELGLGITSGKVTFDYGNPMTDANQTPTSVTNWNPVTIGGTSNRTTKIKNGVDFYLRPRAFAGVEFFIANQISIGGELSLGLDIRARSQGETTREEYLSNQVMERKSRTRNGNEDAGGFGFLTYNNDNALNPMVGGNIFLMFYF
ncbi:MAG: hypothetical protein LBH34_02960 [Prevotellaceae bacterium]|nr:hypothetical protein [Prevotellaceae bacterium]